MRQKIYRLKLWKKKPIAVCSILGLLILLALTVRCAMPCREYSYEGNMTFQTGVQESRTVYSEIALNPGIYIVELQYSTDTDLGSFCRVQDGTVMTEGQRSNAEALYSGLDKTESTLWLFERTKQLNVVVDYNGEGSLTTGNLVIRQTRGLWIMLMALCVFVWCATCLLLTFRYYNQEYIVPKEKKQVMFWLMVITFLASLPYLCGYNITGADLTYHLQRIEGVRDGLLGGQFPVRIEPRWAYGQGYANAIFYCNAFLYLPAILRLLGFTICTSYNVYCILLNLFTAWISYYCFARMCGKDTTGLICSALYTLSIFRIYKLLITSAVGEGTAFSFLPLVFYGLFRIFTEDSGDKKYKTAWIPLMLGFAGLIQSHVLTCEITAVVTLVYCLFYIRKIFSKNTFLELFKGALGAILLSFWFLVPFLDYYLTQDVHIKHVSARTIQERGLYPAHQAFHFWTDGNNASIPGNGMQYSHPQGIGLVLLIGLAIFLLVWFSGGFRKNKTKTLQFARFTSLTGILLLCMSQQSFPWDRIQALNSVTAALVSSLQFPNRFLGWATVCMVFLFGYCLGHFENRDHRVYLGLTAAMILDVATSSIYLLDHVNSNQDYYEIYSYEGMGFGYISGAEYLIQGTDESELTFSRAKTGQGVSMDNYTKKYLSVGFDCINESEEDSFVELPLLLYKGYRAVDAASSRRMQIFAGDNQNLCVSIPSGYSGRIQVDFVSPVYWRVAEMISLAAIVFVIFQFRRYRRVLCRR